MCAERGQDDERCLDCVSYLDQRALRCSHLQPRIDAHSETLAERSGGFAQTLLERSV
jgi:hypothetical protein